MDSSKVLIPLGAAFLGGMFSFAAVFVTQHLTLRRERLQYRCTKLERAYLLVNMLYNSHKTEIDKLAVLYPQSATEWLKSRQHPGDVMNELKMIIRMYAPGLRDRLNCLDTPHQELKCKFGMIEDEVRNSGPLPPSPTTPISTPKLDELRKQLTKLGVQSDELKDDLIYTVYRILGR